MTVRELRDALARAIVDGKGDLEIVVGFDDVPDHLTEVFVGGIVQTVEGPEVQTLWYSQSSAVYEFVDPEDDGGC